VIAVEHGACARNLQIRPRAGLSCGNRAYQLALREPRQPAPPLLVVAVIEYLVGSRAADTLANARDAPTREFLVEHHLVTKVTATKDEFDGHVETKQTHLAGPALHLSTDGMLLSPVGILQNLF